MLASRVGKLKAARTLLPKRNAYEPRKHAFCSRVSTPLMAWGLVLDALVRLGAALAPVATYLPQFYVIKRGGKEGFAPFVCLFTLVAAELRIASWAGSHERDLAALVATTLGGVMQLLLLDAVVSVKRKKGTVTGRFNQGVGGPRYGATSRKLAGEVRAVVRAWVSGDGALAGERLRALRATFWAWDELAPYVEVVVVLALYIGAATVCFHRLPHFNDAVYACGEAFRAAAGLPQVVRTHRRGDAAGLSLVMVGCWLAADAGRFFGPAVGLGRVAAGFRCAVDAAVLAQIAAHGAFGRRLRGALCGGGDEPDDKAASWCTSLRARLGGLRRHRGVYAPVPKEDAAAPDDAAAPEEIPTINPSFKAKSFAHSMASSEAI